MKIKDKSKEIVNKEKEKVQTLKKQGRLKSYILMLLIIAGIIIASLVLIFGLYIIISSPDFDKEKLYSKEATVIYDINGDELARIGKENRTLVNYSDLPDVLIDAIVATEDSRFFQHNGLDAARFMKASLGQLAGSSTAGGASTITMQVVKNTYTSSNASGIKGIIRKFTDIYMAVFKVESSYTKEEIIEFYVNSQWLGGNDGNLNYSGIYGVEQACNYYFGKSVKDISLAEASILAGMFQNPVYYNPYKYPERVKKRQDTVLKLMVNHGYITEEEKENIQKISIESLLLNKEETIASDNQAAIDYVLEEAEEKTGLSPYTNPMKIYSTINPSIQNVLNDLANGELYTFIDEYMQEGVAITSVEDGSISGLSGGRNYTAKGLNRATDIKRQPGSTIKVIMDYGPYIEYVDSTTYKMLLDESTTYTNGTRINNADDSYLGLITMTQALVKSRNIPALRVFKEVAKVDQSYIENFAHSLGIDYGQNLYESASIGGFDGVSPLQMSAAYATFARGGYYIKPYSITKITILETDKTENYNYKKEQVMSEETAFMVTKMLVTAGDANVGGYTLSDTDLGAKTGTTTIDSSAAKSIGIPENSTMDAWNITFSTKYCISVWTGYDTTTKEHYLTSKKGVPMRKAIMKALGSRIYKSQKGTHFEMPKTVTKVTMELETFPGSLASEFTPESLRSVEYYKKGTEPTDVSTRFSTLDNVTNLEAKYDGTNIKISWTNIKTPDAIDYTYLQNYFNTYYEEHASKYYDKRIAYNNTYIGSLGYQIYLDTNGSLTYLGRVENNNFTYSSVNSGTEYKFIVKSAYSIFKDNISSGASVTVNTSVSSNVQEMIQ